MELVRGGEAAAAATGEQTHHKPAAHPAPAVAASAQPADPSGDAKRRSPEKAIPLDDHELKQF
jgi:hypothetical protein